MLSRTIYIVLSVIIIAFHVNIYSCITCSFTAVWWNSLIKESILISNFPVIYTFIQIIYNFEVIGLFKKRFYSLFVSYLIAISCLITIFYWIYLLVFFSLVYDPFRYSIYITIHSIFLFYHYILFKKKKPDSEFINILDLKE